MLAPPTTIRPGPKTAHEMRLTIGMSSGTLNKPSAGLEKRQDETARTFKRGADPACHNLAARPGPWRSVPPAPAILGAQCRGAPKRVRGRAVDASSSGRDKSRRSPTDRVAQGQLTSWLRVDDRDRDVACLGLAGHGTADDAHRRRLRWFI